MAGQRAAASWRSVEAFCAVARHGSVIAAAGDLGVTASALSHLVRALEARLGVALLERSGRGVALTEDGTALAAAIGPAMRAVAAALDGFGRRRTELRISALSTFATRWLIPRLAEFQVLQPDIDLLISTSTRAVDLHREAFDCAVRLGRGPWPDMAADQLYAERLVPACSPALALRAPADLRRARLLHGRARRDDWARWLAAAGIDGVDVAHGTVLETRNLAIQAAIGQMGVLVIDPQLIAAEVAAGQLMVPFGPAVAMECAYWLVARPGQGGRPYTAFRRWILAQARAGVA